MGDFLVAYFHTRLEAITSAKKLMAYGVQRDRVTIHVPEKPAKEADSTHSSSSPDDNLKHRDAAETSYDMISEEPPERPLLSGSSTLAVTLKDHASINDVCLVLKDAGAYLIDVTEHNVAQEYPDM
jgi:hypothetical protein